MNMNIYFYVNNIYCVAPCLGYLALLRKSNGFFYCRYYCYYYDYDYDDDDDD